MDNTKTTLTISTEPCPDTPEKTDDLVTPFQAARPTSDLTPTLTPTAAVNPKLTSKHNSTGTASNGSPTLIKAIPTTKSHRLPLTLSLPEDYEAALDTKDAILLTSTYAGALQLLGRCDELAKVFLACSEDPTKEEWALVRDAHGRHRLLVRDAWAAAVGAAKAGDNDGAMPKKLQHLLVKETCEGLLADAHAIDVDYCAYVLGCIATLYEHGVISRGGPMASLVFTDPIIRLCGMDAEFDVNYKGHWAALLAFATNASRCIKYDRGFDLMLGAAVRETERRIATFRAKSWAALQRTYGSAEAAAEVVAYVNGIANVLAQRCADDWMRLPSKRRDALQSGPFRLPWTRAFVRDWCAYALPNPHRIPTTEMPEVVIKMMRWVGHCGRDALGAMPQKTLAALGSDLKTTLDACTFCSTWMEASVGSAIGDLPRQVAAECCVRLGGGTMQAGLMAAVGLLA